MLPTREQIERSRWLRPLAHRLKNPALWQLSPESVARGAAVGLFWAFVLPIAQTAFAVMHCVGWRANIPVAVAATLVTNPLTIGPWLWAAHFVGSRLLPMPNAEPALGATVQAPLTAWLTSIGLPAAVGMGVFALTTSVAAYLLVKGCWLGVRWVRTRRTLNG